MKSHLDEILKQINEVELEKLLKNRVYALICDDCGGGGADGQKTCERCDGNGLHTWRTTELKDDLEKLIRTSLISLLEKYGEEIIQKIYPKNPQQIESEREWDEAIREGNIKDARLKVKEIITNLK